MDDPMATNQPAGVDENAGMKRKSYDKELRKLQVELCHLQAWVKAKGARIIIVFEGRDAAGKGGTSHHRAGEPARLSRRGAAGAFRPGEDAIVHAEVYRAVSCGRRDRDLRPQLV
jgi:hypothetical protein